MDELNRTQKRVKEHDVAPICAHNAESGPFVTVLVTDRFAWNRPEERIRKMSREYAIALGARLRAVRLQRGMTLQQVQQRSGGRWSRVILGCYERADRAVSVATLVELAAFYGLGTEDLLPTEPVAPEPHRANHKITIDLQRIPMLPPWLAGPLARYTSAIQRQRGNHTSAALTIRTQDLQTLAIFYDMDPHALTATLTHWGVLIQAGPARRRPRPDRSSPSVTPDNAP